MAKLKMVENMNVVFYIIWGKSCVACAFLVSDFR